MAIIKGEHGKTGRSIAHEKTNAFVVLLVLIPVILITQCKKEYPHDYKTTTPTLITNIEGNNEDPFLMRAKNGTIYLVWFSERSGNADIISTSTRQILP